MSTNDTTSEEVYDQMLVTVRQSFARLYSALKARELRTLRQLQAVKRQCETSHTHAAACLRGVHISYADEESIITNISRFGELHLDALNLEGDTFLVEDYVSPDEDHMYSYKCIDEIAASAPRLDLNIEEAALRQITESDCVCSVHLTPEQVSKRFREDPECKPKMQEHILEISNSPSGSQNSPSDPRICVEKDVPTVDKEIENGFSKDETAKINPTEEWLNCIKSQIETEPTQVNDLMEHSTIVC